MPTYMRGHVRRPDKDDVIRESQFRHARRLRAMRQIQLPSAYDLWTQTPRLVPELESTDDDQSQCGSCWDFSGTEVAEAALMRAQLLTITQRLSKQYTLDCGQNGGCNGDDNTNVLDWAKTKGLPLSSDYGPYQGQAGRCKSTSGMKLWKIDDWGFADGASGDGVTPIEAIKQAIIAYGRVGCAVAAGSSWDGYQPGTVHTGNSTNIDHDVCLDGWQDTGTRVTHYVAADLVRVQATGWWWMANSWGPGWGKGGRMQIAYGADSIGTETVWAVAKNPNPPTPPPIDWGNAW